MNSHRPTPPEALINAATIEKNRYKFEPVVADIIALPVDLQGIVAIRQWKLEPGLFLNSTNQPRRYSSSFIWADLLPDPHNHSGIYAHQLLDYAMVTSGFTGGCVIGIVELAGRVIEHTDGIHRAECCRVLQFLAHTSLAARLSRVYGVPCVIADCSNEAGRKMVSWLGSHDGIRCLQWNLQFPADLGAEKLLSEIESLSDGLQQPVENDDIPEARKDRGRLPSKYTSEAKLDCRGGGIVIRNEAIKSKYPGGMEAFTVNHQCIYNDNFTMVIENIPGVLKGVLTAALADMADHGIPYYDAVIFHRYGGDESSSVTQKAALDCWLHTKSGGIAAHGLNDGGGATV